MNAKTIQVHFQKMDIEYQWTLLKNDSQCSLHAKMYNLVQRMECQHNLLKRSSVEKANVNKYGS